jgi:hypothetical protein
MDAVNVNVKAKLVAVLQNIQTLSGETCPAIDGSTRPVEALPNFTSKVWPVAAGMLGIALGKSLPCETNIFVDEQSKAPLSLDQTVAFVIKLIEAQEVEEVVA